MSDDFSLLFTARILRSIRWPAGECYGREGDWLLPALTVVSVCITPLPEHVI